MKRKKRSEEVTFNASSAVGLVKDIGHGSDSRVVEEKKARGERVLRQPEQK